MLNKYEILAVIIVLLLAFYLVMYLGAGRKNKSKQSTEIKKYLFGVRVLISIIAIVSLLLWFLM